MSTGAIEMGCWHLMAPRPENSLADPLLQVDSAPRDANGAPVRAPIGNSIMTFFFFGLLLLAGLAFWWIRRPSDLTMSLGGREWVITDVDGEPAINATGFASTFVLDGTNEVRGMFDCNIASGTWIYSTQSRELTIDWLDQTLMACPDDWPETHLVTGGNVNLDHGVARIESDAVSMRAVSLADLAPAQPDEFAGGWTSGGSVIEIGRRGLFRIDTCRGTWSSADDAAITVQLDPVVVEREGCALEPIWRDGTPIIPVRHDGSLYLHHVRPVFPLDRSIIRLDPAGPEVVSPPGTP